MRRHACAHIHEPAQADLTGAHAPAHHRHPFPRVFGPAPGRVVAVIGGEDRQIAGPKLREEPRQARIEPLQRPGLARHVARMAGHRL